MMAHTPGPWSCDYNAVDDHWEIFQVGDEDCWLRALVPGTGKQQEDESNARLMATAPELLAACEAALEAIYSEHPHSIANRPSSELQERLDRIGEDVFDKFGRVRAVLKLRAAIAKAREQIS